MQSEVILPGGLSRHGRIERKARFRPLTGRVEQALVDGRLDADRPGYVSRVLGAVLDSIGDCPADHARIANLCVADRQYLMLRLAAMMEGELMWLKVDCGRCEQAFDVELRRCDLPVKPAGEGFPQIAIRLGGHSIDARVPTGEDQECIAGLEVEDAVRQLLSRCIERVDGAAVSPGFVGSLSDDDVGIIDDALDAVSPAVCDRLLVTCPECGQQQQAELDHYAGTRMDRVFFYDEIHTLASHYHWSEAAILDLPQSRRRLYLELINRSAARGRPGPLS